MIVSPLFTTIPGILHGFGTREPLAFPSSIVTSKQVHGRRSCFVEKEKEGLEGYDALITNQKGIAVAVRTADCLPILLVDPEKKLIAAVHAGWRGTVARIAEAAVDEMISRGASPEKMLAALGPSIGRCCYEVGADVAVSFQKEFKDWSILTPKGKDHWYLDVAETNRLQLLRKGLKATNIDRLPLCTFCRSDLFFSYRKNLQETGRMVNFIQLIS